MAFGEKLPKGVYWKSMLGYIYVKAGQREKALALWNELEEQSKSQELNPFFRGMMAAYLGFTEKAFELLNDAVDKKSYPISYINVYPCTESIRKDPRYEILLKKINLYPEPSWLTSKR